MPSTRDLFLAAIGQTPLVLSEQTIDSVTQFLAKSGLYVLPEGHAVIKGTEYKASVSVRCTTPGQENELIARLVPVQD